MFCFFQTGAKVFRSHITTCFLTWMILFSYDQKSLSIWLIVLVYSNITLTGAGSGPISLLSIRAYCHITIEFTIDQQRSTPFNLVTSPPSNFTTLFPPHLISSKFSWMTIMQYSRGCNENGNIVPRAGLEPISLALALPVCYHYTT